MSIALPALADLTHDDFTGLLNTWFRLQVDAQVAIEVELTVVEPLPPIPGFTRRPFRLVFRSRDPNTAVPQGTYRFHHDTMGELEVFVVPRGPDRDRVGMTYDATFS